MKIILPFCPSANHYLGRRGNISFLTEEAKDYIAQVQRIVSYTTLGQPMEGPLHVHNRVYFPDMRVRDLGNLDKVSMDACTRAGLWVDDNWQVIPKITWEAMGVDRGNQRIEMEITCKDR